VINSKISFVPVSDIHGGEIAQVPFLGVAAEASLMDSLATGGGLAIPLCIRTLGPECYQIAPCFESLLYYVRLAEAKDPRGCELVNCFIDRPDLEQQLQVLLQLLS
jgi:hypothetical protein